MKLCVVECTITLQRGSAHRKNQWANLSGDEVSSKDDLTPGNEARLILSMTQAVTMKGVLLVCVVLSASSKYSVSGEYSVNK